MAAVAATVTVVTAYSGDTPIGITVSAFTSVSVDPPIVLVCIDKIAVSLPLFLGADGFTVNLLPEDARAEANLFATRNSDKFDNVVWSEPTVLGAGPVLGVAYGGFECVTIRKIEMGDHWVIFGRADAGGRIDRTTSPLLYLNRDYTRTAS